MATAMIMLIVSAATLVLANLLNRPVGASRVDKGGRGRWLRSRRASCNEKPIDEMPDIADVPFEEESFGR